MLRQINFKLTKKDPFWKEKWIKLIPYKLKKSTLKDWFLGRVSIPLVALDKLKFFDCNEELSEILDNIEYVSNTTGNVVKIPISLCPDLIYLSGLILGDGCLTAVKVKRRNSIKYSYRISIAGKNKHFFELKIVPLVRNIFQKECSLRYERGAWNLIINSKAIYRFFTKIIGISSGKKSINARIPDLIKLLPSFESLPFLAGLIDSDIGRHGHGLGCTFRSKKLVLDLLVFLSKLGITARHYGTHYKSKKYEQNDFTIPKNQIKSLKDVLEKNYLPKQDERILAINELAGM
ncbi:MAG: hypothetical protein ABIA76_01025 [Candidatus Diapherotrites archaeon]